MKQDQFKNEINIGDRVIFNNQDYHAVNIDFQYGTVTGFTPEFVIISPEHPEKLYICKKNKHKIYRKDYKLIVDKSLVWKNNWIRLAADTDNYKKNVVKRAEDDTKMKVRSLLLYVVDFVDDINRALDNMVAQEDKDGLLSIYNKLLNTLSKYKVKPMDITDAEFNPDLHDAISVIDMGEEKKGKIIDIISTGYMIDNDVLRHAKVTVGN